MIDVGVTNLGTETWAWGWHGRPEIRLSYLGLDHAERTPLPHDLAPGETTTVPLAVRAPDRPGRVAITVDLVHERHRWFDCGAAIALDVQPRRRAVVLVGQPPGDAAFDRQVDDVLLGLDPGVEPLLVGPKPDWLRDRFRVPAQARAAGVAARHRPRRPRRIAAKPAPPPGRVAAPAPPPLRRRGRASGSHAYRLSRSVLMRLLRIPKAHLMPSCEESP